MARSAVADRPTATTATKTIRVRATAFGFYGEKRYPGDVFDIDGREDAADVADIITDQKGREKTVLHRTKGSISAFAPGWMEKVDPRTPLSSGVNDRPRSLEDVLAGKTPRLQPNAADLDDSDDTSPTGGLNVLG